MTLIPKVVDELRAPRLDDVARVRGRHHPRRRSPALKAAGVAGVFTPGSPLADDHRLARSRRSIVARRSPAAPRQPSAQEHRWICSSTRASSCSRATASRCRPARSPTTVDEAVARRRARRLSGRRQGAGAGRRARQGRRHQARERRRRGAHARRATSSAWTSRATSCSACGSSTRPTSPRSTTRRSRSTAAAKKYLGMLSRAGRRRDRDRSPRRTPTRSRGSTIDPVDGLERGGSAARGSRPRS